MREKHIPPGGIFHKVFLMKTLCQPEGGTATHREGSRGLAEGPLQTVPTLTQVVARDLGHL